MEKHFECTACGKCCQGWLPLTLPEALRHADSFPLAVIWTPVKQGHKAFDITAKLGWMTRSIDKKPLAIRITPMAYIPSAMPCPFLTTENLCRIHLEKPSRCRTMPFFPYVEEQHQAEQLALRPGWACNTSESAPVVYRDKTIVMRDDFDQERADLIQQTAMLKAYAERISAHMPIMAHWLTQASKKPGGGHVVVGFASLLSSLKRVDKTDIAHRQSSILLDFAAKTAPFPQFADYTKNYQQWSLDYKPYLSG